MLAYRSDPAIKSAILADLDRHRIANAFVQSYGYWENGRGCAVGCTIHSDDHLEYEFRFGIPAILARLEDCIFEGLPIDLARQWPMRFMDAIIPGADLSLVGWQFLHWLLTDASINPGIDHPTVRDAVRQCAAVLESAARGATIDWTTARTAALRAEVAARSASGAARCAANSADQSAWSAAWSTAGRADWITHRNTTWNAMDQRAVSDSMIMCAGSALWHVARSAGGAWDAWDAWNDAVKLAEFTARVAMADKLISLIEATAPTNNR
jgi:hypothetical protein